MLDTLNKNSDPTSEFIEAMRSDAHKCGSKIAKFHFEGDMADVMGEVLGDLMFGKVVEGIGNSLYNVPSVLCAKEKLTFQDVLAENIERMDLSDCWEDLTKGNDTNDGREVGDSTWKFYINGKEIDGSRAVGEYGVIHMWFEGAKDGDVCKMVSPRMFLKTK